MPTDSHPNPLISEYPSWVPRYDEDRTSLIFETVDPPHTAASGIPLLLSKSNEDKSLVLQGLRIDRIAIVSEVLLAKYLVQKPVVASVWNQQASILKIYPTGERLIRAFSLTMLANATSNKHFAAKDPVHDSDFAAYLDHFNPDLISIPQDDRRSLLSRTGSGNHT